jgi:hypothetical protein
MWESLNNDMKKTNKQTIHYVCLQNLQQNKL